jgi:HPt (histidine-containing phosphotransfer) domain-containing protein
MTVIDPDMLASLQSFGDPEFVAEVIDLYIGDAPPRIETMRSAIAEGDAAKLAAAAHALKSSSGNVGATAVREICAYLEANTLAGAAEKLVELEREQADAVKALREIVASGRA